MERIDASIIPDVPYYLKPNELEFVRFAYIKKEEYAILRQVDTDNLYKRKVSRTR